MKKLNLILLTYYCCFSVVSAQTLSENNHFIINANIVKAKVQPTMYGIFFEDLNMAADGGVYAELIKNRSFEFADPLMGWVTAKEQNGNGKLNIIDRKSDRPDNPHFLSLTKATGAGTYGIQNLGFRGMGIHKNETYIFSVMARRNSGNLALLINLVDETGSVIGTAKITPDSKIWKKYTAKFKSSKTSQASKLSVLATKEGNIDLDMISLFPEHTWKNRPGGLRADLVQKLADLKPGFLRFPGGCIVEGRDLATRYQWKKTIGDIDGRENIINRWNTEVKLRPAIDYYQTFGLGFLEYFILAEDIGATPLPILNCGMACQFNTGELAKMDEMDPYIQDALDLIEFANGNTTTKWGKLRTQLGHPKPFNMKFIGVGNEQWGEDYIARWLLFNKAIKEKYPMIKIISSVGPSPDGEIFDFLNVKLRGLKADILDEHYYSSPKWFKENVNRYNNYDRNGPKIFAGEYAAQSDKVLSQDNRNNLNSALSEAAFMTGLERNADVVMMASYAPLLAHVDGWQWKPDLIWFDNLSSYGTPNYFVQQLFSLNKGTHVIPITLNGDIVSGQSGLFASAVLDSTNRELIVKMVNVNKDLKNASFNIRGVSLRDNVTNIVTLQNDDLNAENSISNPNFIRPAKYDVKLKNKSVSIVLKPFSFNVIKIKIL